MMVLNFRMEPGADKANATHDSFDDARGTFGRKGHDGVRHQNEGRPEADQGVNAQPGGLPRAHTRCRPMSPPSRIAAKEAEGRRAADDRDPLIRQSVLPKGY